MRTDPDRAGTPGRASSESPRRKSHGNTTTTHVDAPPPAKPAEAPAASSAEHPGGPAPSSTTTKVTAAAFVGDYTGEDVSTYRLEGLPDREERDPNAKITAKSKNDTEVNFVLVDSSNGKDICTLTSEIHDNVATIAAGQKCFEQDDADTTASATVTKGTATLDGTKLTFDLEMDFGMSAEGRDLSGTLGYHFQGSRK